MKSESPSNCNFMLDRSGMNGIIMPMNKLPSEKRAQALQMMAEGVSLRAITRLTGISRTTLIKLLEDAGQAFSEYQDRTLRESVLQTHTGR